MSLHLPQGQTHYEQPGQQFQKHLHHSIHSQHESYVEETNFYSTVLVLEDALFKTHEPAQRVHVTDSSWYV